VLWRPTFGYCPLIISETPPSGTSDYLCLSAFKNKKQYEKGNHQQNRQFHCHRTYRRTQHVLHAELCDEVK
jgi:hypothetical protein